MASWKIGLGYVVSVCLVGVCVVGAAEEGCPQDSGQRASLCMKDAGLDLQGGKLHAFYTDPMVAKDLCVDGKLQQAVTCLEDIFKACMNEMQAMNDLTLKVNVDDWKAATKKLCDNVDLFIDNKACFKKGETGRSVCIDAKTAAFQGEMQSKKIEMGNKLSMDVAVGMACTFSTQVMKCIKKPLKENCPKRVSSVLSEIYRHLLPPACKPASPGYGTVTDDNTNDTVDDTGHAQSFKPFSLLVAVCVFVLSVLL